MPALSSPEVVTLVLVMVTSLAAKALMPLESSPSVVTDPLVIVTSPLAEKASMPSE